MTKKDILLNNFFAKLSLNKMSSSAFATTLAWSWDAHPEFNDPALKSPVPCNHHYNCTYEGCCAFVHPGEEGTDRKLFPARVTKGDDGIEHWQPAVVRLIGYARGDAGFYERRRLRLSWAQWCERKGWPAPSAPAPSHRRREVIDIHTSAETAPAPAPVSSPVSTPVQTVSFPVVPSPQLVQWFQTAMHNLTVQQLTAARNALGTDLMGKISVMLTEAKDELESAGWFGPRVTPYFLAGTLLERYTYDQLYALAQNTDELHQRVLDLCEELSAPVPEPVDARIPSSKAVLPPPIPSRG